MIFATLFAAAACMATPVHGEPLAQTPNSLSALRWVQATPNRAGIVGLLFADTRTPTFSLWTKGQGPNGPATKILWLVRNVHAGRVISLRGYEIGSATTFRQTFSTAGDKQYPSIVKLPYAGCWQLELASGGAKGTLVVLAFPEP
ncbi:MAG TPA: hypothetical protein VM690_09400 [Gaiellaceae bacterium]|nr:hypothetical protein [Gaiellaceae bacterium]